MSLFSDYKLWHVFQKRLCDRVCIIPTINTITIIIVIIILIIIIIIIVKSGCKFNHVVGSFCHVIVDYRVCIDSKDSKRYTDTYFCKHCRLFISFGQYLYIILLLTGYVEKDGSISTLELWISLEVWQYMPPQVIPGGLNTWIINRLHPNISMHILYSFLHKFPKVLSRRIWWTIKSLFSWWLSHLFSWP